MAVHLGAQEDQSCLIVRRHAGDRVIRDGIQTIVF
jgi:hypothetical protein